MWPFKKLVKANGIDPEWVKEHTPKNTWDMARLEQFARQPVFIYNQMKRRHRGYDFIDEWSQFRGTGFTFNDNWIMWKKKLGKGTFPIAMRVEHSMVPTARIKGELFLIDSYRIKELDEIMVNGVEFRRKKVLILIPYCHSRRIVNKDHNYEEERIEVISKLYAWMYVGRYTYWSDFLDAGYNFGTCKRYNPNGFVLRSQYYDFTELEFEGDNPLAM